jgi:O-succinylbenzoate synthase
MAEPTGGKKPLAVYAVIDRKEGQKSIWIKIGAAFTNRDGSMSLLLDAFPIGTNRLQVREQRDWEARPEARPAGANGEAEDRP